MNKVEAFENIDSELLKGEIIISTRPIKQAFEFAHILELYGAKVYHLPMIEIIEHKMQSSDYDIVDDLDNYDWLVFQSANAVRCFFNQLPNVQIENLNSFIKIASIGDKTSEALSQYNITVDLLNSGNTGEELANLLREKISPQDLIVIPSGDIARKIVAEILPNKIEYITVYKTILPKNHNIDIINMIKNGKYGILTFASPSSVLNLKDALGNDEFFSKLCAVCIGDTTAAELIKEGVQPIAVSKKATNTGMVDAIVELYKYKKYGISSE